MPAPTQNEDAWKQYKAIHVILPSFGNFDIAAGLLGRDLNFNFAAWDSNRVSYEWTTTDGTCKCTCIIACNGSPQEREDAVQRLAENDSSPCLVLACFSVLAKVAWYETALLAQKLDRVGFRINRLSLREGSDARGCSQGLARLNAEPHIIVVDMTDDSVFHQMQARLKNNDGYDDMVTDIVSLRRGIHQIHSPFKLPHLSVKELDRFITTAYRFTAICHLTDTIHEALKIAPDVRKEVENEAVKKLFSNVRREGDGGIHDFTQTSQSYENVMQTAQITTSFHSTSMPAVSAEQFAAPVAAATPPHHRRTVSDFPSIPQPFRDAPQSHYVPSYPAQIPESDHELALHAIGLDAAQAAALVDFVHSNNQVPALARHNTTSAIRSTAAPAIPRRPVKTNGPPAIPRRPLSRMQPHSAPVTPISATPSAAAPPPLKQHHSAPAPARPPAHVTSPVAMTPTSPQHSSSVHIVPSKPSHISPIPTAIGSHHNKPNQQQTTQTAAAATAATATTGVSGVAAAASAAAPTSRFSGFLKNELKSQALHQAANWGINKFKENVLHKQQPVASNPGNFHSNATSQVAQPQLST